MDFKSFILYVGPIILLELLAATAGIYYLKKTPIPLKNSIYLVYFLWLTVFFELVGSYAPIAYYSDYKLFSFVKGTLFEKNTWWYNIFTVLNFAFFTAYFVSFLRSRIAKLVFKILVGVYLLTTIIYYIFSDDFFHSASSFINLSGMLLLLFGTLFFYFELLRSDLILKIKYFLPFYISVGVLVFNLTVTPIDMLSKFFTFEDGNRFFVSLHLNVFLFANIFLYLSFIIGFIVCSRKKGFLY